MADRDQKTSIALRWALAIAQGLILAGVGWFGKQQVAMHDQLNHLSWQVEQMNGTAQQVRTNATSIDRLDFRVKSLEARQAKDEAIRERQREATH